MGSYHDNFRNDVEIMNVGTVFKWRQCGSLCSCSDSNTSPFTSFPQFVNCSLSQLLHIDILCIYVYTYIYMHICMKRLFSAAILFAIKAQHPDLALNIATPKNEPALALTGHDQSQGELARKWCGPGRSCRCCSFWLGLLSSWGLGL